MVEFDTLSFFFARSTLKNRPQNFLRADARLGHCISSSATCWELYEFEFKSAPHISPGALCAASDPMAIQPDSGFPDEGISFVHKALACQPEPFPSWNPPDYFKDSLKLMQN